MAEHEKEEAQRWTTKRKAALVLSVVKGETSIQEAARKHGLTVAEMENWKEPFFLGAENSLRRISRVLQCQPQQPRGP